MRFRWCHLFFFYIIMCSQGIFAQSPDTAAVSRVARMFAEWKTGEPGYAIGITRNGKLVYQKYFGLANMEYHVPLTAESIFDVGSVSKQFTAACIAILQLQGKLSINDPITKYLTDLPAAYAGVKISNLIYHTGGVRQWEMLEMLAGRNPEKGYYTNDIIVSLLKNQQGLNFKQGEQYQYSNGGYILLAEIVRKVSGQTLKVFSKQYLFDPLGMSHTFFLDDQTMIYEHKVNGYLRNDDQSYYEPVDLNNSYGGGNLHTTVGDLGKWQNNYIHQQLDGGEKLRQLLLTAGRLNNGESMDYGFGLELGSYKGVQTIAHTGYWPGFRSRLVTFPKLDYSVIFITNNSGHIHSDSTAFKIAEAYAPELFLQLRDAVLGSPAKTTMPPVKQTTAAFVYTNSQLKQFTGLYYSVEINKVFGLKATGGHLIMEIDQDELQLTAGKHLQFTYQDAMVLLFKKKKRVEGFSLSVADQVKGLYFVKILTDNP